MKEPAKKIIMAIILSAVLLDAGFSFAQNDIVFCTNENQIYFSEDEDNAERKKEFWEKFRESVKPREKDPQESEKPKEVHPREVHPKEVHPKETE